MSGTKFDIGKIRMDLIDYKALQATATVLTFGAEKYGDNNWREGFTYGRLFASTMRHLTDWYNGIDIDPETGLNHMHHVACNVMFLQTFIIEGRDDLDDRVYKKQSPSPFKWSD